MTAESIVSGSHKPAPAHENNVCPKKPAEWKALLASLNRSTLKIQLNYLPSCNLFAG